MSKKSFLDSDVARNLANYKFPRYEQLTQYPIIMSQLDAMLDDYLSIFLVPGEEKLLTPAMINSYVRTKVIKPPKGKTYTKNHIVHLMGIGILKQVLSINDIGKIIDAQIEQYPIDDAYNYFCAELEDALKVTFGSRDLTEFTNAPKKYTQLSEGVHSAVLSFANKIFVKKLIYFMENNK